MDRLDIGLLQQYITRLPQFSQQDRLGGAFYAYLFTQALDVILTQLLAFAEIANPLILLLDIHHTAS